jgi:hypothetical protein
MLEIDGTGVTVKVAGFEVAELGVLLLKTARYW